MGKIRVKTIGDDSLEQQQKEDAKRRKEAKKVASETSHPERPGDSQGVEGPSVTAGSSVTNQDSDTNVILASEARPESSLEEQAQIDKKDAGQANMTEEKPATKSKYKEKNQKQNRHSTKYRDAQVKVDKNKQYAIKEAIELLSQVHLTKFDETVELHVNTNATGVSGNVVLPHGNGKKTKVAIASDELISDIENGKIEFDILLAQPEMMAKLAKVARVLGPKGLMPNPKNGTITQNPTDAAKKYEGGQVNFKTEAKSPLLHVSIGKLSFKPNQLEENYKAFVQAIGAKNIKNVTMKSTMSPAIKIQL